MRVCIKVEVTSLKGAKQGVPALLRMFREHGITASFQISTGPDYSEHPLRRILPWFVLSRLPVKSIADDAAEQLKPIVEEGHEIGIGPYSAEHWRREGAFADEAFTRRDITRSVDAFNQMFNRQPQYFGATDWQVNPYLLRMEDELGFKYASDVRGKTAFLPTLQGVDSNCVQVPATLPTIDELLANPSINEDNVHEFLFAESQRVLPNGEVFCVNAEREGVELLATLESLIVMWKGSQWDFKTLDQLQQSIEEVPARHQVGWTEIEGRTGHVAMQSLLLK
ncbi:MAG: polysaccharide deacetylase family protein [Candidatus Sedimenticola sp. 20ELBAFRAG]